MRGLIEFFIKDRDIVLIIIAVWTWFKLNQMVYLFWLRQWLLLMSSWFFDLLTHKWMPYFFLLNVVFSSEEYLWRYIFRKLHKLLIVWWYDYNLRIFSFICPHRHNLSIKNTIFIMLVIWCFYYAIHKFISGL